MPKSVNFTSNAFFNKRDHLGNIGLYYREVFYFTFNVVFSRLYRNCSFERSVKISFKIKEIKGKGHPCTGTEALYRPYGS
jgi:hypothetical protein